MNNSSITETGNDLKAIYEEQRAYDATNEERTKWTCPRCGTPLDVNSKGVRNCPLGHYRAGDELDV